MLGHDRFDHQTMFGLSKVVMMEVDCAVVAGEYVLALDAAERMQDREGLPLASQARHLTDVAHAHTRLGRHEAAERLVLSVAKIAPRWIKYQAFPRAVVAELVSRRRPSSALMTLAERLGVDRT